MCLSAYLNNHAEVLDDPLSIKEQLVILQSWRLPIEVAWTNNRSSYCMVVVAWANFWFVPTLENHHFIDADIRNQSYTYKMVGPDPIGENVYNF